MLRDFLTKPPPIFSQGNAFLISTGGNKNSISRHFFADLCPKMTKNALFVGKSLEKSIVDSKHNQASNLFFVQLAEIVLTSYNLINKGKGHCTGNKTDYLCPPLSSTGRGLVRLRRLVWDQEIAGSNPAAPTSKPHQQ